MMDRADNFAARLVRDPDFRKCLDYIQSEYQGSIEDVAQILRRNGIENLLATIEIAGYFTGCMTVEGEPRVGRRPKDEQ